MDNLKPALQRFLDLNKRINDLNKQASELRDQRRTVELDLSALYASTRDLPNKVELKTSGMVFNVKRPNEWKKGWTLSKKELEKLLHDILPEHGEEVMKEIERRHTPTLVSDEYSFELRAASKSD